LLIALSFALSTQEPDMFASIRRYRTKDIAELTRRVNEGFLPLIEQSPGFVAYYVVDGGDGWAASISLFETRGGAEQSTLLAAGWVRENLAELVDGAPEITQGEVLVSS
jgi:hypothetical protein